MSGVQGRLLASPHQGVQRTGPPVNRKIPLARRLLGLLINVTGLVMLLEQAIATWLR